ALLLLHANRPVHAETLVDHLWGDAAPSASAKTLHSYVSNLRRLLDEEPSGTCPPVIVTQPAGYVLRIEEDSLDSCRFERLVREGQVLCGSAGREEPAWTEHDVQDVG